MQVPSKILFIFVATALMAHSLDSYANQSQTRTGTHIQIPGDLLALAPLPPEDRLQILGKDGTIVFVTHATQEWDTFLKTKDSTISIVNKAIEAKVPVAHLQHKRNEDLAPDEQYFCEDIRHPGLTILSDSLNGEFRATKGFIDRFDRLGSHIFIPNSAVFTGGYFSGSHVYTIRSLLDAWKTRQVSLNVYMATPAMFELVINNKKLPLKARRNLKEIDTVAKILSSFDSDEKALKYIKDSIVDRYYADEKTPGHIVSVVYRKHSIVVYEPEVDEESKKLLPKLTFHFLNPKEKKISEVIKAYLVQPVR